jgi:Kdo2-lipid IVA lauroyltransferase/acyltransferase
VYYTILLPVSYLPLPVLYFFTDIFYLLLISFISYRRKVVRSNIERSFPNLSANEKRRIERRFYRHLTDLLAEGVKNLSISDSQLKRRITVSNPKLMQHLFQQKKDVLLISGHYNNWEWLITAQNILFDHQAVGIGMPLSNKFWDKQINARRSRFGMHIIHSKIVHDYFQEKRDTPIATLVLADQAPGDPKKSFWMEFLNQTTPVVYGPEMLAHRYNQSCVFFHLEKVRRGYYKMHLELITDDPKSTSWGEITTAHAKKLEHVIQEKPEFWLWSHKRWKRAVPENLEELREEQKTRFDLRR